MLPGRLPHLGQDAVEAEQSPEEQEEKEQIKQIGPERPPGRFTGEHGQHVSGRQGNEGRQQGQKQGREDQQQEEDHAAPASVPQIGRPGGQQHKKYRDQILQIERQRTGEHQRKGGYGQSQHQVVVPGPEDHALCGEEGEEHPHDHRQQGHDGQQQRELPHLGQLSGKEKAVYAGEIEGQAGQQKQGAGRPSHDGRIFARRTGRW